MYKHTKRFLTASKLVQVELEVGDTYNDLFKGTNEWNNEAFINTARWIDFNTENQEDTSVFDQIIADGLGFMQFLITKNEHPDTKIEDIKFELEAIPAISRNFNFKKT